MSAVLLLALALLAVGASLGLIVALAAGIGLATPPLGACVRTPFGAILPDRAAVQAAYALDASAEELTWISGPPLALGIGMLWSTGAALAIGGGVLLLGTVIFAAQPGLSRLESQPGLGAPARRLAARPRDADPGYRADCRRGLVRGG